MIDTAIITKLDIRSGRAERVSRKGGSERGRGQKEGEGEELGEIGTPWKEGGTTRHLVSIQKLVSWER